MKTKPTVFEVLRILMWLEEQDHHPKDLVINNLKDWLWSELKRFLEEKR